MIQSSVIPTYEKFEGEDIIERVYNYNISEEEIEVLFDLLIQREVENEI